MGTITLYEAHQEAWGAIAMHKPSVAEMAKHFSTFYDMEGALGYGSSVVSKWVQKRGGISQEAERRAKTWLDTKARDARPAEKPIAPAGKVLLVACSDVLAEKAIRILTLLGCDVTEV